MTTRNNHTKSKSKNTKTRNNRNTKIQGYLIKKKGGWKIIHIYGDPYNRGYAHGVLLYKELSKIHKIILFTVKKLLKVKNHNKYKAKAKIIHDIVKTNFPELYQELSGISEGAKSKGVNISVETLVEWNSILSLYDSFSKKTVNHKCHTENGRCSAFIACGDATASGKIVMAHNTHADYVSASTQNIVIYVTPENGMPFVMQTCAGMLASTTDWFISSSGIMGCETTITKMKYKPVFGDPYFCRIRKAMQYGRSLDEYVEIMLNNNAGDYSSSWLLGNFHLNEIMLFDIGLKKHHIERTNNGLYYGMNSALNTAFKKAETNDKSLHDTSTSCGARNKQLNELLNHKYYGKIDINIAEKVIADHYDVYLKEDVQNKRSICKHSDLDPSDKFGKPFYPWGCTDGKVVDTDMAKKLTFMGRFGASCGQAFYAKPFLEKHPEYKEDWSELLEDRVSQPWTKIEP
jgi:hypothetical protein